MSHVLTTSSDLEALTNCKVAIWAHRSHATSSFVSTYAASAYHISVRSADYPVVI